MLGRTNSEKLTPTRVAPKEEFKNVNDLSKCEMSNFQIDDYSLQDIEKSEVNLNKNSTQESLNCGLKSQMCSDLKNRHNFEFRWNNIAYMIF